MPNLIGEPIPSFVANQINARQSLHGAGAGNTFRTGKQLSVLNSNTSWIKLASGVSIDGTTRLSKVGIESKFTNLELAKTYILNSGFSKLENNKLIQRQGFNPQKPDSSYSYGKDFGYVPMPGIISADIKTLNRGSIKKATVKLIAHNKNQFNIIELLYLRIGYTVLLEWGHSLFTRDGATRESVKNTVIEDKFFDSGVTYQDILKQIKYTQDKYQGNYDGFIGKISNFSWSVNSDGSFDIELNLISLGDVIESLKLNISPDFKLNAFLNNTSVRSNGSTIIPPGSEEEPSQPLPVEQNKNSSIIHGLLYVWKFLDDRNTKSSGFLSSASPLTLSSNTVGAELFPKDLSSTDPNKITSTSIEYIITVKLTRNFYFTTPLSNATNGEVSNQGALYEGISFASIGAASSDIPKTKYNYSGPTSRISIEEYYTEKVLIPTDTDPTQIPTILKDQYENTIKQKLTTTIENENGIKTNQGATEFYAENYTLDLKRGFPDSRIDSNGNEKFSGGLKDFNFNNKVKMENVTIDTRIDPVITGNILYGVPNPKPSSASSTTIDNPVKDAPPKSVFRIDSKSKNYYIRLGYLLEYINENVIPRINNTTTHKDRPKLFDIAFGDDNVMFSIDGQMSLDPRVAIVNDGNGAYPELIDFKSPSQPNQANIMNIYLNFDFVIESLSTDERGDTNVYDFLTNIYDGLNKALGGINNIEPTIDETENIVKPIDTTPNPNKPSPSSTPYFINLMGYLEDKTNNLNLSVSNFVRKFDLKTAITPEFATMVTVGATAGGYVKGVEATAFSKWNDKLIDRFKETLTPGNPASAEATGSLNEPEVNFNSRFNDPTTSPGLSKYGLSGEGGNLTLDPGLVDGNLSIGTEYYKYVVASSKDAEGKPEGGGTVGFIPFKLSITMDGLSGMKIYNKLIIDTNFLPQSYGTNLDFIVTGISHKISNQDWETDIETTVIPSAKPNKISVRVTQAAQQAARNEQAPSATGNKETPPNGTNGRLLESDLVVIATKGGRQYKLNKNAAEAYKNLREAAKQAGFNLDKALSSAYRSVDDQIRVRRGNLKDKSKKDDINYLMTAPSNAFNLPTGKPGYSNHGFGKAIDVSKGACNNWLRKNAYRYGFWWYGPSDPVHFTYGTKSESGHAGYIT